MNTLLAERIDRVKESLRFLRDKGNINDTYFADIIEVIDDLFCVTETLSDGIRDGIELNYGGWLEWQQISRDMFSTYSLDNRPLNSFWSTLPIAARKGLVSKEELCDIIASLRVELRLRNDKEQKGGVK